MAGPTSIDVHAHYVSEEALVRMGKESPKVASKFTKRPDGGLLWEIDGRLVQNPTPLESWDVDMRLRDMDANRVGMQLLSNMIQNFNYRVEPELGLTCAQIQNQMIADLVGKKPDRFLGLATLPMQDGQKSADELRRAMTKLGLKGAHIGSHINGRNLDDPALDPLWAVANEHKAFMFIHPLPDLLPQERLANYYSRNFVGLPFETTIAATAIVFGGVIERFPEIRFCLSHAGGYVPYQMGRAIHAWEVRSEAKKSLKGHPKDSYARLYFDSISHAPGALKFMIDTVGADRVLLGSDYPFDMGNLDCVAKVEAALLPATTQQTVLAGRVKQLFGMPA